MKKGDRYIHYRNRKTYIVFDFCKIQINDEWVNAVIYYLEKNPSMLFCRELTEFRAKFQKIQNHCTERFVKKTL